MFLSSDLTKLALMSKEIYCDNPERLSEVLLIVFIPLKCNSINIEQLFFSGKWNRSLKLWIKSVFTIRKGTLVLKFGFLLIKSTILYIVYCYNGLTFPLYMSSFFVMEIFMNNATIVSRVK